MAAVGAVGAVVVGTATATRGDQSPCPAGLVGPPRGEGRRAALKETLAPRRDSPFMVRAADGLCPVEVKVRSEVR